MSAIAVDRPPCIMGEQHYHSDDHAPGDARRHMRGRLGLWRLDHLSEVLELVVSELVTNAVLHAGRPALTLRLSQTETSIIIQVWDGNPQWREHASKEDADLSGRGLQIVRSVSHRLSWYPERGGKTVWAEVLKEQH